MSPNGERKVGMGDLREPPWGNWAAVLLVGRVYLGTRRRTGSKAAGTAYTNTLQCWKGEWPREEIGRKGVGEEKRLQKPAGDKSPLSGEVGREVCLHCNGKRREATGGLT